MSARYVCPDCRAKFHDESAFVTHCDIHDWEQNRDMIPGDMIPGDGLCFHCGKSAETVSISFGEPLHPKCAAAAWDTFHDALGIEPTDA